ncbi:MAG: hypothetical protein MUF05_07640 [Candidatus Omnitrophica bacterium]|jgi:hypothetical protein|nr:hypothetical protein [Candidatus Omnitrophota bacterium]
MTRQMPRNKVLVIVAVLVAFTAFYSSDAFAWGSRGGHGRYYYHGGHWDNGWFWGFFAAGLTIGTIVAALPPRHQVVYVSGTPYYYYDDVYYRPCHCGYVVVPAPKTTTIVVNPAVAQIAATSGETILINIPNSSGGYTSVSLTKHKTGYIGPQGEYYQGHPTVEQLRALYGK